MWFNCGITREGDTKDPERGAQDDLESSKKALAFVLVSFPIAMITDPDKRN